MIRAGHRVVHERAGQQLAVLVVDERLVERPAEALGGAAPHLALDEGRVERPPDVLGDHVVEDGHLARLAIDPDVDKVRGARRGQALLDRRGVALDRRMTRCRSPRAARRSRRLGARGRASRPGWTTPSTISRSDGSISNSWPAYSSSWRRASSAAPRTARPAEYVTTLPPLIGETGAPCRVERDDVDALGGHAERLGGDQRECRIGRRSCRRRRS